MITFTGGIIGYVASLFASIFESSQSGKGKLFVYQHILILNWNTKALELIADYQYDDETTTVVILSSIDKEIIESAIKRKFYDSKNKQHMKLNVIVRQGEVFSKIDLENVCIEQAKTIIILADEEPSDHLIEKNADILAMKTVMLVSNMNIKPEQTVIVEIKQKETAALIHDRIAERMGFGNQVITIFPDELMGRLIAQTILMPDLNHVYQELFSFEGVEVYTVPETDAKVFMETHSHGIPIFNHHNHLFVIAENYKSLDMTREYPLDRYQSIIINEQNRYHTKNIIVFGRNNKLDYILDSIELYQKENNTKVNVTLIESNDVAVIEKSTKEIEHIDTILILSRDYLEPKDYDSDVLVTLLLIQDIAKTHQAEIIIELLDPRHYDIAQSYNIQNTIISNKYVSRLMTQLSKNRYLNDFYLDLLTYDEADATEETYEIYAYQAHDIIDQPFPLTFASKADFIYSCYQSGKEDYIVIGLLKNNTLNLFKGNLDEGGPLIIEKEDVIITICK
ncbi:MAG: hypothetical protein PHY42_04785 [Bacilli bacterium]|nr:hypothetical protein [Bacilli bacterium]